MLKRWKKNEVDFLIENYPHKKTAELAELLGRNPMSLQQKAHVIGLKKSAEFIENENKNLAENGKKHQFKKGCISHNKGQKMPTKVYDKVKPGFFKKGHKPHNTKYDGYIVINADGYKMIRLSEGNFVLLQRKVWQDHHGEIPTGHIITFKDRNPQNCDISNLEMITKAENAVRNQLHKYPVEIQELIKLKNTLKKKINEKQN